MSVSAMEEEIRDQAEDIPKFASTIRESILPKLKPSTLIFAGSGDSYAAAVFAQELSTGQAVASDPYELLTKISRVRGKNLVIVSVSGRTRANVELARRSKRFARKRIAVTSDPDSPLANECDETLSLKYRRAATMTPGTISFTASLIACAFILGQLPKTIDPRGALGRGGKWAKGLDIVGTGTFVFLGSSVNYALSVYGAAKIREVLGVKAEADYPEQIGHSRLFSLDKTDDTIICTSSGHDRARQIHMILTKNGFQTKLLAIAGGNTFQGSLEVAIHLQLLALALARKRRMIEPAFLTDQRSLKLSSKMIYEGTTSKTR
jgi:fructoselysine-6-P-deglycase FrlB-like protein